ncbi:MAG TPA: NUDIX domain-containing protein [Catenuloplanes sp.]|jgi:ADP-ribose pyrophosphatase YjhB (NUDIX family)
MHTTPRVRVAAYVIRHSGREPQLLVFDHIGIPDAGTQVPAGGVKPGESLHDAVLREVAEETGLTDISVLSEIASEHKPHPETGQPRHTTYFHVQAPAGTSDSWQHTVTGTGQDSELEFACRFVSLPLQKHLADRQDAQLHRIDPGWTTGIDHKP